MNHVHKLVRFSNGDVIIGEVLEDSLKWDHPSIQITNVFKVHQIISPEAFQMTTMVRYLHFIEEQYISINKDHISFLADVSEDVIEYMDNYEEDDLEEDEFEKFATAGMFYANTAGKIH